MAGIIIISEITWGKKHKVYIKLNFEILYKIFEINR